MSPVVELATRGRTATLRAQSLQYSFLRGSGEGPTNMAVVQPTTTKVMTQPPQAMQEELLVHALAASSSPTATVAPIWQCVVDKGQPWPVP